MKLSIGFAGVWLVAALTLPTVEAAGEQPAATIARPIVSVRSPSGAVTVIAGADVRLVSGNAALSHFTLSDPGISGVRLPRVARRVKTLSGMRWVFLPARRLPVPEALLHADGISVSGTGGNITVAVPHRMGALFINAGAGDVIVSGIAAPYVIQTDDGAVRLRGVRGHGLIRTVTGNVDLTGVGGFVRVESGTGSVGADPSGAQRVQISTAWGDINWTFGTLGRGEYRFRSRSGAIRLYLRPDAGAQVDAQSDLGSVINGFDRNQANASFASAHELSLTIGAGGPEISAYTKRGTIVIAPALNR